MRNPVKTGYKQGVIVLNFDECDFFMKTQPIKQWVMNVLEENCPRHSGGLFHSIENQ